VPGFVNYKKGALDSEPQMIKFTTCFPMVGGSSSSSIKVQQHQLHTSSITKTGRHDIAEILLKHHKSSKAIIKYLLILIIFKKYDNIFVIFSK
jgi:hypothetical protein